MRLSESEVFAEYAKTPQDDRCYDFYRCHRCSMVFSRQEELRRVNGLQDGKVFCKCGACKFTPSWPRRFEWLKPDIARYTAKLILARGLAPILDRYAQWALPAVERMVRL